MSQSSNSVLPIIAGSLAVVGSCAAASFWNCRRHASHAGVSKSPSLIRNTPTADSEKPKQVVNASMEYFYHDLAAHIVGDQKELRKRTPTDREDTMQPVHQAINVFFDNFYVGNGDKSVSSDVTDDTSVSSSSDSLEGSEAVKTIASECDDEIIYIEKKGRQQTPCSGSDSVALVLTSALFAARGVH